MSLTCKVPFESGCMNLQSRCKNAELFTLHCSSLIVKSSLKKELWRWLNLWRWFALHSTYTFLFAYVSVYICQELQKAGLTVVEWIRVWTLTLVIQLVGGHILPQKDASSCLTWGLMRNRVWNFYIISRVEISLNPINCGPGGTRHLLMFFHSTPLGIWSKAFNRSIKW